MCVIILTTGITDNFQGSREISGLRRSYNIGKSIESLKHEIKCVIFHIVMMPDGLNHDKPVADFENDL